MADQGKRPEIGFLQAFTGAGATLEDGKVFGSYTAFHNAVEEAQYRYTKIFGGISITLMMVGFIIPAFRCIAVFPILFFLRFGFEMLMTWNSYSDEYKNQMKTQSRVTLFSGLTCVAFVGYTLLTFCAAMQV